MGMLDKLKSKDKKGLFSSNDEFVSYSTGILPLDYANGFWQDVVDRKTHEIKHIPVVGIIGGTFVSIIGDTGTGKMEPVSNKIATTKGIKCFGDLKIGDKIFDEKGKPVSVIGTFPQGIKDVYEVLFEDGRTVKCGLQHLWEVHYGNEVSVFDVEKLLEFNDLTQFYVKNDHRVLFPDIELNLPNHPVMLAAFYNYGVLDSEDLCFECVLGEVEAILIGLRYGDVAYDKIELVTNNDTFLVYLVKDGIRIKTNEVFEKFIDRFGKTPLLNRDFPECYLYIDEICYNNLYNAFIEFDNETYDNRMFINNKEVLDYLLFIFRRFGYVMTVDDFGLTINGEDVTRYCVTVDYKPMLKMANIRKLDYQEQQMCIMVDNPRHLYLTENFTTTHNTTFADQLGFNIIRSFEDGMLYHIDAEKTSLKQRILKICGLSAEDGMDDERLVIKKENTSIEDVLEMINAICDVKEEGGDEFKYDVPSKKYLGETFRAYIPTVFIIDSLPTFNSKEYNTDDLGTNMDQARASKDISRFFNNVIDKMLKYNITVIVINHIRPKVETNPYAQPPKGLMMLKPTETLVRGQVAQYLTQSYFRIDMVKSNSYSRDQEGFEGFRAQIQIAKSKTNFVGSSVCVAFNKDIGFDPIYTLFEFADSIGLVEGRNPYLYFQSMEAYKFNRKDFRRKYIEEKDFRDCLMALLKPYFEALLGSKELAENERVVYGDFMNMDTVESAIINSDIDVSAITSKKSKKKK